MHITRLGRAGNHLGAKFKFKEMKTKNYRIVTTFKAGIKDNAGDAVTNALRNMSFASVKSVRIGKTYYIKCGPKKVKSIAKALVNVVMEDYSIEEVSSYE